MTQISLPSWVLEDWRLSTAACISAICLTTYAVTSLKTAYLLRSKKVGRAPPGDPYWVPGLGQALPFLFDVKSYFSRAALKYGRHIPVLVRAGHRKVVVVSDPDQISLALKSSKQLTTQPAVVWAMTMLFGTPRDSVRVLEEDDSGYNPKPLPGSNIRPENRLLYLQHTTAAKSLTGERLQALIQRFMNNFIAIQEDQAVGHEWVERPDLGACWRTELFTAATRAIAGNAIFELYPNLAADYWTFDRNAGVLLNGTPRWWRPEGYQARDRLLRGIENWHRYAEEHIPLDQTTPDQDPEWEPIWGSRYIRARIRYARKAEGFGPIGMASQDLGLFFASNSNSVEASIWMALEVFRDPVLLKRVRREIESARRQSTNNNTKQDPSLSKDDTEQEPSHPKHESASLDIKALVDSPLLQSIYAETLRLRAAIFVTRTPATAPFALGDYSIPQGATMLMANDLGGRNADIWRDHDYEGNPRPLDQFWADRFLGSPIKAHHQESIEKQHAPASAASNGNEKSPSTSDTIVRPDEFSIKGTEGSYFPYGGGLGMCPGRTFAKAEMIGSLATLVDLFDLELQTPPGWQPQPNLSNWGTGTLPLADVIPFRIRRRVQSQ